MNDADRLRPESITALEDIAVSALLEELATLIRYHDSRYHGEDNPEISDADYDALVALNKEIEDAFPSQIRRDSPSVRVGAAPSSAFGKVTHSQPMLSLSNAFDKTDIEEFIARISRFLALESTEPVIFSGGR